MSLTAPKAPSVIAVITAFLILYFVWGSTYFYIKQVIDYIPIFITGTMRFLAASVIMFIICLLRKDKIFDLQQIKIGLLTGILLLFVANGAVMLAELTLPTSFVAIICAATPLWFVLMDKPMWKENFSNLYTILGVLFGFVGVCILLSNRLSDIQFESKNMLLIVGLIILIIGNWAWVAGSLYSKKHSKGSVWVSTTWQMVGATLAFAIASLFSDDWSVFNIQTVPFSAWASLVYLIIFGSILAYSAYVWLLSVKPATQVSTYAYINPIVAVFLGIYLGKEVVGFAQIAGLIVILVSVLMINLVKYRKERKLAVK